jgi:hypothetical protein
MSNTRNFKCIQAKIWMISLSVLAVSGCQTPSGPSGSIISTSPYVIDPSGTTITGGMFLTENSRYASSSLNGTTYYNIQVNFPSFYGSNVKLDGSYLQGLGGEDWGDSDVIFSAPFGEHTWEVDADPSKGVPGILHTIRGFNSDLQITSPAPGETIGDTSFTIFWTPSKDSNSKILITIAEPDNSALPYGDTLPNYGFVVPDNGSCTIPTSKFPSGMEVFATVTRYVYDYDNIAGKSYIFINSLERTTEYVLR